MIPADVASNLRFVTKDVPTPPQPTPSVQQVADVLSEFSVGQRVMAEIQTLLPNGTYRAMVGQREVTLALPFSAKPGDSLELEVTESAGKLSLAVIANRGQSSSAENAAASASTSLSNTGKLIGELLSEIGQEGKRAQPAPLNGNQPLIDTFPESSAELAPILKEALSKSGIFYESHQARWAQGEMTTAALLQEPQGKLSSPTAGEQATLNTPPVLHSDNPEKSPNTPPVTGAGYISTSTTEAAQHQSSPNNPIPSQLTTLVQQQLYALATENYAWQGQIWPGQHMDWEIVREDGQREASSTDELRSWRTHLKLQLPSLGGVEATLRLSGAGSIEVSLVTTESNCKEILSTGAEALQSKLEATGLSLTAFVVQYADTGE